MRTMRLGPMALAIGAMLVLGATAARGDTTPPIRPEQLPAAATSPAAASGAKGGKHSDPTGATAQCKDGTYSHSAHHSRACRRHGGVDKWLDGSQK